MKRINKDCMDFSNTYTFLSQNKVTMINGWDKDYLDISYAKIFGGEKGQTVSIIPHNKE